MGGLWDVEFIGRVYVTVRVAAADEEQARALADKLLPRFPVVANTISAFPREVVSRAVDIGKDWEINDATEYGDDEAPTLDPAPPPPLWRRWAEPPEG